MLPIFRLSEDVALDDLRLMDFIQMNNQLISSKYQPLLDAYNNDYEIFSRPPKASYKPDNRLSVNFASAIANQFCGFANFGNVKVDSPDEGVLEYIKANDDANNSDDINDELAITCAIYGRGYRIAYVDENGIGSAQLTPMEAFAIYNESIVPKMRYFVRTYVDSEGVQRGSIADDVYVRYFHIDGDIIWDGTPELHGFGSVPAVEFYFNSSRKGLFEDVMSLIDAFNKVLSEKADDCEYFSDSYLKIIGTRVSEEMLKFLRDNRTINVEGSNGKDIDISFLERPSCDGTQENLLNRIETNLYRISMVANIQNESFGTSSGIALKYKLLPQMELAEKAWRKFKSSLMMYYKLLCANPITPMDADDWQNIKLTVQFNYPANNLDEAQTVQTLQGIVSRKTQLEMLSAVDDVDEEMDRLEAEEDADITSYSMDRTVRDEESGDNTEKELQSTSIDRANTPENIEKSIRGRER